MQNKLVKEHISFERGLDPKDAMDIGLTPEEKIKLKQKVPILKRPSPYLGKGKYGGKEYSRGYYLWKLLDYIKKGEDTGGRRYSELVRFYYNSQTSRTFGMGPFNSLNRYTSWTDKYGQRIRPNHRYYLNSAGERFLEKYREAFSRKLIEHINFERGLDPKDAMDIGYKFQKGDIITFSCVHSSNHPMQKPYEFQEESKIYDIEEKKTGTWLRVFADGNFTTINADRKDIKLKSRKLSESIEFKRGTDPKVSMKTGIYTPRVFSDPKEFVNYVMFILPTIFGGKIPDDILSNPDGGMMPGCYYLKIREFLNNLGHQVLNKDNKPINFFANDHDLAEVTEGFNRWPRLIRTELEKMGYSRTEEYP